MHSCVLYSTAQFAEDASPMAHPVRPNAYNSVDNLYSATVYEKGAEVVRMIHTIVGREGFRAGMDLYFKRHDGAAVTCDDFVNAMADANAYCPPVRRSALRQFMNWYTQAGTPKVTVRSVVNKSDGTFSLIMKQDNPPAGVHEKAGTTKPPLHIPVRLGLLRASDGSEINLKALVDADPSFYDPKDIR
jgi:aminopeptidase N